MGGGRAVVFGSRKGWENEVYVLKVTMMEGRTAEQKDELISRLSEAAAEHLGWPLEEVRVAIYEVSKHEWGIGGRSVAQRQKETV